MAALIPNATGQTNHVEPRKRRRLPRASQACDMCRSRKTRCNQQMPCSNCSYLALECHYGASTSGGNKSKEQQNMPRCGTTLSPRHPGNRTSGGEDETTFQTNQLQNNQAVIISEVRVLPHAITPISQVQSHNPPLDNDDSQSVSVYDMTSTQLLQEDEQTQRYPQDETTTSFGGLNEHTQGTEFYGGSSNHAFLNTLFTRARTRARSCPKNNKHDSPSSSGISECSDPDTSSPGHLCNSQLSIVNLLHNTDHPNPPGNTHNATFMTEVQCHTIPSTSFITGSLSISQDTKGSQSDLRLLEEYFAASYFGNKHHIHPFLDESNFRDRCTQMWEWKTRVCPPMQFPAFHALYYAVLSVGAINAPTNEFHLVRALDTTPPRQTTLQWAHWYFDLAHRALGNILETCTIETCQALFLLTIFCQNSLKPHSSYLHSGMAVRTAIAIGLANETYGNSIATKQEARRTWWCIYSHEVEMCCSSGRVDGLKDPRHYRTSLPKWKALNPSSPDSDEPRYAIISVMVDLAKLLQAASQDIYHNAETSLQKKSQISFKLDIALDNWINRLPSFLNFETFALDDAEWVFKQKLVLKFRSYNARILIHRPFLVASSDNYDSSEFLRHVELCLDASRMTVRVIHESLAHRPYLRTWWYCTTYALYASMIILHLVLLDFPKVPGKELIEDVERSLDIFSIMGKHVTVAKRCGELTQEILGVAKTYLQDRKTRLFQSAHVTPPPPMISSGLDSELFGSVLNNNEIWNDEYLIALLNQSESGASRSNALASFLNPTILESFVNGM